MRIGFFSGLCPLNQRYKDLPGIIQAIFKEGMLQREQGLEEVIRKQKGLKLVHSVTPWRTA